MRAWRMDATNHTCSFPCMASSVVTPILSMPKWLLSAWKSFFDTIPLGLCLHCFLCGRPVPSHKDNNACFLVKSVESSSIIFIAGNSNRFKAYGFGTFSAVCFSLFQENFTVRCKSLKNEQQNIDITGTLANSKGSRNGVKDSTLFVQASKQSSTEWHGIPCSAERNRVPFLPVRRGAGLGRTQPSKSIITIHTFALLTRLICGPFTPTWNGPFGPILTPLIIRVLMRKSYM